ncbi:Amino acid transporter [Mycolicibacterium neoaurum]|uniref:Amino acid permease n=1 Tax=Mycolicibacterium neoaurum TaxID=1795 RepID=A0AAV2WEA7_MYCNE|nr:APC family permease [Mycolicibacterium neoaurum]QVI27825.1 APC family permease [Mycolicibacterium neoaurum]TLH59291.1 APC family permease [Mycolicibacterium neoaurum]CDQ42609.1 amino acid permease [Mycolicibacterium neoaurum]SDD11046.1 Amino acid transporter [Mycolicibacterium neoaurum]
MVWDMPSDWDPMSETIQRLKPNAVGLVGVLFMAVATAAPITAMVGNVPIAVGFGNGAYAPAGYFVATIVLTLFAIGYAAMSKHITATGAFYGYISHGLGRIVGLGAGFLTALAYMVFEASLIGIFSFFGTDLFSSLFGVDVPWLVFALVMLAVNALLTYFDINLAAKVLGVFLVTEIVMLAAMALSVLFTGGGPQGWSWGSLNPLNGFQSLSGVVEGADGSTMAVIGSAGVGLFFAFWSWVGFESSAMYGEESRNPKKIIPIAVVSSVIGIGAFYVIVSWLAIVGTGPENAIALAQDSATAGNIFFNPVHDNLGQWAVDLFKILLMTGSFACGMAFHNCAARYLYALGREDVIPGMRKTLGATHRVHGSPHIAGFVQTGFAFLVVLFFDLTHRDPYTGLYGLMALLGTTAIMIVQALAAFSVISYFHVHKRHPETANWFTTFLAPLLGGLGMVYVVYLLAKNASFAAGAAATDWIFAAIPWVVGIVGIGGVLLALFLKYKDPQRYAELGRTVLEEAHER